MHEYSLASAIVTQIEEIIEKYNVIRVKKIIVSASPYEMVIPDLLQEAYKIITHEMEKFKDSELLMEIKAAEITCIECDYTGEPTEEGDPEFAYNFLCPKCGSRDTHINMKQMTIETVDLELSEE